MGSRIDVCVRVVIVVVMCVSSFVAVAISCMVRLCVLAAHSSVAEWMRSVHGQRSWAWLVLGWVTAWEPRYPS